jgi:enoyl-CoA hydratase/carnithine racemase
MAAAHHLLTVEDGIAVVTLNRPEALNSLNRALRMELAELFPRSTCART